MPKASSSRSRSNASSSPAARPPAREQEPQEPPIPADFNARVYEIIRRVPEGRVTSYGSIARQLGHPRHSRLVGQALKHLPARLSLPHLPQAPRPNAGSADGSSEDGGDGVDDEEDDVLPAPEPNPDWVPWHRVVASSGVISPRGNVAAVRTQAQWLEAEGVEVRDGPRAGVGAAGPRGRDGEPAGVDAFGLGGAGESGGRVSMSRYGWDGDE